MSSVKLITERLSIFVSHVILTAAAIIMVFPFLYMVRTSFTPPRDYFTMPPEWIFTPSLAHYKAVLFDSEFPRFLLNSLIVSVTTVVLTMIVGSLAGYALARFNFRHKDQFLFFALTTRMGPPVAFALPFFTIMLRLRLTDTFTGIVVVYVFMNLAFAIWMTQGFFRDVPREVEEAAMVEGCSHLGALTRISIPLASPGLVATAILIFITTWNEFFYAFILTRSTAKTFPVHIPSFFGAYQIQWGQMFAATTIASLPILIFGIVIRRYLVRGLTLGAIK